MSNKRRIDVISDSGTDSDPYLPDSPTIDRVRRNDASLRPKPQSEPLTNVKVHHHSATTTSHSHRAFPLTPSQTTTLSSPPMAAFKTRPSYVVDNFSVFTHDQHSFAALDDAEQPNLILSGNTRSLEPTNSSDIDLLMCEEYTQSICIQRVDVRPYNIQGPYPIILRSEYANYVLSLPSNAYKSHYAAFVLPHHILRIIVQTVINNPNSSWAGAVQELANKSSAEAFPQVTVEQLQGLGPQLALHLQTYLSLLMPKMCMALKATEPIQYLLREFFTTPPILSPPLTPQHHSIKSWVPVKMAAPMAQTLSNIPSVCTPTVAAHAINIFPPHTIRTIGSFQTPELLDSSAANVIQELSQKLTNRWNLEAAHPVLEGHFGVLDDGTQCYQLAEVYQDTVKAGNFVYVWAGRDANEERATQGKSNGGKPQNPLLENFWIAQIQYFFYDKEGRPSFHAIWLDPGSRTVLEEQAHPQELFLLSECDSMLVECILAAAVVAHLPPDAPNPVERLTAEFFVRYTYDTANGSFEDSRSSLSSTTHIPCSSCPTTSHAASLMIPGLSGEKIPIHLHDFVYISPSSVNKLAPSPFRIGQVKNITLSNKLKAQLQPVPELEPKDVQVSIQWFWRSGDLAKVRPQDRGPASAMVILDQKCLYPSGSVTIIQADEIAGKCNIQPRNEISDLHAYRSLPHHFYTHCELDQCASCEQAWNEGRRASEDYLTACAPLKGIEIFAGIGGLSTGLDNSGFLKTKFAIENDPSAAINFVNNHADSQVWCHSVNDLLERLLDPERVIELRDTRGKLDIYHLAREQISAVYGGFPCQPFSMMNSRKRDDDCRRTLCANLLSWIDRLQPAYCVLENVDGILYDKGPNGERLTVVKFLVRTLLDLGYQVRYGLLKAAAHGVPQMRRRFIILAARRGRTLPLLPQPSHAYPSKRLDLKLPATTANAYYRDETANDGAAPLPTFSVREALKRAAGYNEHAQYPLLARTQLTIKMPEPGLEAGYTQDQRALIQGFPHDFEIEGKSTEKSRAIGNAVPPPLAKAIGMEIGRALVRDWCVATGRPIPAALYWNA